MSYSPAGIAQMYRRLKVMENAYLKLNASRKIEDATRIHF